MAAFPRATPSSKPELTITYPADVYPTLEDVKAFAEDQAMLRGLGRNRSAYLRDVLARDMKRVKAREAREAANA